MMIYTFFNQSTWFSHVYQQIHFDILNKETGLEMDNQLSFNIEVKDINDNAPSFVHGLTADVPENTPEGERHKATRRARIISSSCPFTLVCSLTS